MLKEAVDAFLSAATASNPDVSFQTDVPGPDDTVQGCLLVHLKCFTRKRSSGGGGSDGSSSGSSRVLDGRELQAWQDMVAAVVALMDAGSKRDAAGGSGYGEYDQEEAGGAAAVALPRLCVTYLDASLSSQLAISRRRTTSKLLRRSAKVREEHTRQCQLSGGKAPLACGGTCARHVCYWLPVGSSFFFAFAACPLYASFLHSSL